MTAKSPAQDPIRQLVGQAALALDAEAFDDFLALCTSDFSYRVSVMSPELGREMTWLEQNREELEKLFAALPDHVTRIDRLTRQVSVAAVEHQPDGLRVTSSVSIFSTDVNGQSALLAVGRYVDHVIARHDELLLSDRELQLDTRDIGIGSHVPL